MSEPPRPQQQQTTNNATGVIIRRSCMGKQLSFADLRLNCSDDTSNERIVKIAFRRSELVEESSTLTPFPTKKADMPYGAVVNVSLKEREGTETMDVVTWDILEDPKQMAETLATVGDTDGLSYSKYLRERAHQFTSQTIKGQKIRDNNGNTSSNKRPRTTTKRKSDAQTGTSTTTITTNNDDLAQDGGHGDKVAKARRAKLFAQWILETFPLESLQQGVLDVAGGKGGLSIELAAMGKVPCVVIDPLIRKKHSHNGTTSGFPVKREAKRIRKAGGPLPRHLPTFFNQTTFLERYGNKKSADNTTTSGTNISATPLTGQDHSPADDSYLVQNCNALIGLHPDQTTEDILDISLEYNKSIAIVPCCVFPSFFPIRKLQDGTMVNNHAQFCQYLCQKDPTGSLQTAVLPFEGRNIVIYRIV